MCADLNLFVWLPGPILSLQGRTLIETLLQESLVEHRLAVRHVVQDLKAVADIHRPPHLRPARGPEFWH